jgi:16S rRNA (uracil1498-N3)-methyltransferase
MNIFYAPPSQINNGIAELTGQEAIHASKVLRAREGDEIMIVDGEGGRYQGPIRRITKESVQVEVDNKQTIAASEPSLILGMGIIKKRDRLEFAVEKAVELGVSRICLFRSEHTVKENVRMDRLESTAISAMKQSLRAWLPGISVYDSFEGMLESFPDATFLIAHEKAEQDLQLNPKQFNIGKLFLLVGPEGGFSAREVEMATELGARVVSLGSNRLRTETAAVAMLSKFL